MTNLKSIINKYLTEAKKLVCSKCGKALVPYVPKGKGTHMVCPVWIESLARTNKEGHDWVKGDKR